jgi:hypothetical protein
VLLKRAEDSNNFYFTLAPVDGVTDSPSVYFLESAEPLRGMPVVWIELLGLNVEVDE